MFGKASTRKEVIWFSATSKSLQARPTRVRVPEPSFSGSELPGQNKIKRY